MPENLFTHIAMKMQVLNYARDAQPRVSNKLIHVGEIHYGCKEALCLLFSAT